MSITSTFKLIVDQVSVQKEDELKPVGKQLFSYKAFSVLSSISSTVLKSSVRFLGLSLLVALSMLSTFQTASAQDCDIDGVQDSNDFCVNCLITGGPVNNLGCAFPTVCDTIETTSIAFDTSGMNNTAGYITIFVLADSVGVIVDTSSTPQFDNVTAGKYMITALDYEDDASLSNFAIGDTLDDVTANCFEWSNALTYRICPQEICNDGIDNDEDGFTDCDDSDCPDPIANATANTPLCEGDNLLLNENGGEGVAWSWSGPSGASSNSQSFGLANVDSGNAGVYSVTVTGANSCTAVSTVTVTVNNTPTATTASNGPICDGDDLNLTESGGDAVSWSWTGPNSYTSTAQNPTISGATTLASGTYNLTITDGNSCTEVSTVNVTVNSLPAVTAGSNSPLCDGDNISLTESGGDGVSWSWTGPNSFTSTAQNPTISGATTLATGSYTVVVTDANSCTNSLSVNVSVNAIPTVTPGSNSAVCTGNNILLTESGGDGVSWSWTGPNSFTSISQNPVISGVTVLSAGTYNVTITDANNCTAASNVSVTVNATPAVIIGSNGPICDGDDLNLTESGGDATSWSWTGPNSFTSTAQNPTISGATALATGTYNLTITDINSCSSTSSVSVTVYDNPVIDSVTPMDPSSCVITDGTISIAASGGTGSFEYRINGGAWTTANLFTGLAAGNYNIEVRNDNGFCTIAYGSTVTLSTPSSPTAEITVPAAICSGSSASFTATDAGVGATYDWVFGAGASPATASGIGPHVITYSNAGTKTIDLTVTLSGCVSTDTESFTVNANPAVSLTLGDVVACEDEVITALNGASPGGGIFSGTGVTGNNFDATVAGVGTHTITYTYTDGNGCSNSVTDDIEVFATPSVTLTLGAATTCESTASFALSGGSPAGGVYSGLGVSSGNFDPSIAGVGIHPITYTYTDGNGCVGTDIENLEVFADPTVTLLLGDNEACEDDADITLSGGQPAGGTYTGPNVNAGVFEVSTAGPGTYTITYTFTTVNGCSESATEDIVVYALPVVSLTLGVDSVCIDAADLALTGGSPAGGTYSGPFVNLGLFEVANAGIGIHTITYTYTDANGCINTDTDDIEVLALPVVTLTLPQTDFCVSDASLALSGGSPLGGNYSGSGIAANVFDPAVAGVGTHQIDYTYLDGNNCLNTAIANVTVWAEPTVTGITANDPTSCGGSDGSIVVTASGGQGSYEYRINGGAWSTSNTFSGLSAGSYNIDIQNLNGTCIVAYTSNPVLLSDPNPPLAEANIPSNDCIGETVVYTATDAGVGATYSWNFGANASPATATGIGPHNVTYSADGIKNIQLTVVKDGCSANDNETIEIYTNPALSLTTSDFNGFEISCFGASDGTIDPGASGGTGSYTYLWNTAATSSTLAGLAPGNYSVTVTDANGCTISSSVTLAEPTDISTSTSVTSDYSGFDVSCQGAGNGEAEVTIGGGVTAYGILWENGQTTTTVTNLTAGTHRVTITDANGCIAIDSVTLTDPSRPLY